MQRPASILADSTMLYSAILFNGPERRLLKSGGYVFYTADFNLWELGGVLKRKNRFSHEEAKQVIFSLPVFSIPFSSYESKLLEADAVIGWRDKKDVPLLALAMSIENDGIWTSDKDFEEAKEIMIWRTKELLELL